MIYLDMKKNTKDYKSKRFLQKPEYPGGIDAMRKFINKNLKYPLQAVKNNTEGAVILSAEIDYNGKVISTKLMHGIGDGCDEEAIRIVKLMRFTKVKNRGVRIKTTRRFRINFNLSSKSAEVKYISKNEAQKIVYSIKKSPDKTNTDNNQPDNSYSYTISW